MSKISLGLIIVAAAIWGLAGGVSSWLMKHGWNPFVLTFYAALFGLIFTLAWLTLQPRGGGMGQFQLWIWSIIAGVGFAGNVAFYFLSIQQSNVAIAVTLIYSAPVFVYLVSFALGLERPSIVKAIGVLLVILGLVLLTGLYRPDSHHVTFIGVIAGLLSGLFYALFIFALKNTTAQGSPPAILSIAFAIMCTLLAAASGPMTIVEAFGNAHIWLVCLLGVFGLGLAFALYFIGLRHTTPSLAAVLGLIEPITASLFGLLVLGQSLRVIQVIGAIVILGTISLLSLADAWS